MPSGEACVWWCFGSPDPLARRSVAIRPGATRLTVMPRGASSTARPLVRPTSPAFAATTWARSEAPAWAESPPRLMMRPPSGMVAAAAWAHRNEASRMLAITARQSSKEIAASGASRRTAALLTSTSTGAEGVRRLREQALHLRGIGHVGEHGERRGRRRSRISSATPSTSARDERAFTTTAAPSSASASAIARPMLRAAPVTSATLPESGPAVTPDLRARARPDMSGAPKRPSIARFIPSARAALEAAVDHVVGELPLQLLQRQRGVRAAPHVVAPDLDGRAVLQRWREDAR